MMTAVIFHNQIALAPAAVPPSFVVVARAAVPPFLRRRRCFPSATAVWSQCHQKRRQATMMAERLCAFVAVLSFITPACAARGSGLLDNLSSMGFVLGYYVFVFISTFCSFLPPAGVPFSVFFLPDIC